MKFKPLLMVTALLSLLYLGCTSVGHKQFVSDARRPESRHQFFVELDAVVQKHHVGNAAAFKISGFPYLRSSRFLAALGARLTSEIEQRQWVAQMRQLDLAARAAEIKNLPDAALADLNTRLTGGLTRDELVAVMTDHSRELMLSDLQRAGYFDAVKAALDIPDEYSIGLRVIGLYPLTSIPVTVQTKSAYKRMATWYETPPEELEVLGTVTAYAPPIGGGTLMGDTSGLFEPANRGPLGYPRVTPEQLAALAMAHAPLIHQDVAADYDRFGQVEWGQDSVSVDTEKPTVYYYLTHAFLDDAPVLQINYSFWYTERAGPNAPSIEKGPLDGMTIRVNLDLKGTPVMVDVMNNCGCYFLFVPDRQRVEKVIPDPGGIDPFVPAWLPDDYPRRPLNVRVNSGWHQMQQVFAQDRPDGAIAYALLPYEQLESLPRRDRRYESVFDDDGIMKDSKRIEPYIFFPMGISKIGYMRQRGHHAIKLVGRAHFTDPYLHDENFKFH